jgi:CheY-like chemotaxis protein
MESKPEEVTPPRIVMLIDDSSIDNFVNQKMIERHKFSERTVTFTKAAKAMKYLSEIDEEKKSTSEIPFIIFLDLNMPLINGFQFLEVFEQLSDFIKSRCKIVILTSSINPNDIIKCKENKNVLTFLNKPLIKNNFEEINLCLKNYPDFKSTISF